MTENFAGSVADAASPQPYDDDALPKYNSWNPSQLNRRGKPL